MVNPHLFRASKCGKTDRVLILNSKRKTAQNRTVEPFSTGRGRRTWSRLPARSVLLHTLYAEVSAGDPHPSTLSECLVFIFCTYKKQQTPQKRCLLFWQGQKDLVSPAGSVGASAYFVCRGLRRRPAPLDTLRVPRFHFLHIQKTANTAKAVLAVLAGAEGIEPSALGFGDRCSTS